MKYFIEKIQSSDLHTRRDLIGPFNTCSEATQHLTSFCVKGYKIIEVSDPAARNVFYDPRAKVLTPGAHLAQRGRVVQQA
jgi:hypothetical protein